MKSLMISLLSSLCLLLTACNQRAVEGRGASKTESRPMSGTFSRIEISAPIDARITVGPAVSVTFEGYANLLPYLRTEVRNSVLLIDVDESVNINAGKQLIANITLPALTALVLNGSGNVTVTGAVNAAELSLDVNGSGDMIIRELHAQSLKAGISGSGNLTISDGDARRGTIDMAGSGGLDAAGLIQQEADIDISGSATASVQVTEKLHVAITGSGSVTYTGHPDIVKEITGSGDVSDGN